MAISMMRMKSPLSELNFRENKVEQIFVFFKEDLEREIILFFCQNIFYSRINEKKSK